MNDEIVGAVDSAMTAFGDAAKAYRVLWKDITAERKREFAAKMDEFNSAHVDFLTASRSRFGVSRDAG